MYAEAKVSMFCPPLGRPVTMTLPEKPENGRLKLTLALPTESTDNFTITHAAIVSGENPDLDARPLQVKTKPEYLGSNPDKQGKFVAMHPGIHLLRFTLAWLFNVFMFLLFCFFAIVYGMTMGPAQVNDVMLAWVVSLLFTWAIAEPGQVGFLVMMQNSETLTKCRNRLA